MRRPAFETIEAPDFDLALTLDSGQVFHWEKCGRGFTGAIDSTAIYVEQRANQLRIDRGAGERVRRYFALDHSLPEIYATFPADKPMCAARDLCRGLRIIRQPKWECLATFITSSMKQVAHIRQMSRALRTRFGERIDTHGHELHAFPTAERIAGCSESDLRACALGYRAANLLATARRVSSDEANLDRWADLKDEELRARLCELPGVGAKVANCVLLFAYERLRAFPIDVWIERVLRERYLQRRRKLTSQKLRQFCDEYFGVYGGYAQQYLFHHARTTASRKRKPSSTKPAPRLSRKAR